MNRDTLKLLLNTRTKPPPKKESGFYQEIKTAVNRLPKRVLLTRIENWMTLGIPDLLICDDKNLFHFVELKVTRGNVVKLSANQVSWLTRYENASVWVLVRTKDEIYLYNGKQAVDLRIKGLQLEPIFKMNMPFDWPKLFRLIFK